MHESRFWKEISYRLNETIIENRKIRLFATGNRVKVSNKKSQHCQDLAAFDTGTVTRNQVSPHLASNNKRRGNVTAPH